MSSRTSIIEFQNLEYPVLYVWKSTVQYSTERSPHHLSIIKMTLHLPFSEVGAVGPSHDSTDARAVGQRPASPFTHRRVIGSSPRTICSVPTTPAAWSPTGRRLFYVPAAELNAELTFLSRRDDSTRPLLHLSGPPMRSEPTD